MDPAIIKILNVDHAAASAQCNNKSQHAHCTCYLSSSRQPHTVSPVVLQALPLRCACCSIVFADSSLPHYTHSSVEGKCCTCCLQWQSLFQSCKTSTHHLKQDTHCVTLLCWLWRVRLTIQMSHLILVLWPYINDSACSSICPKPVC